MIKIINAINALKADAQVSINNNDINQITWYDDNPTNITNKQITDKQAELQTAYNNNKYQRDRANEYPSIVDQLDNLYHNGIDGWMNTIKAIKDK